MTDMSQQKKQKKADEMDEVIDASMTSECSCSVTMSEGHAVPQYYGSVIMLGGAGATCPT